MKNARLLILLTVGLFIAGCLLARDPVLQRLTLEGTWYSGGDRKKVCRIDSTGGRLEATNEHGQTSRLISDGPRLVRALDWEGGLRGEIRRDRIDWANGTHWTQSPSR